jgi:predicted DNA-binding protein (MmcQ/YjbR family)
MAEDRRLTRLTKLCLELPDTSRELQGSHAAFRAGKKVFAYFLNNHHGDGIVSVCVKVFPGENTSLVASQPDRFYPPAYIAHRGWVGLRLDQKAVDWEEVAEFLKASHMITTAKPRKK